MTVINIPSWTLFEKYLFSGGIAQNQVIARSEFEVHRQMFTE